LGIGRTFQIPRPFRKLSLIENVTLAAYYGAAGKISRAEAQRRAEEALDMVGLPFDPSAGTNGLGAAALKKLELARALDHRASPPPFGGRINRRPVFLGAKSGLETRLSQVPVGGQGK